MNITQNIEASIDEISSCISAIRATTDMTARGRALHDMRTAINNLYPGCEKIIYTDNLDKRFFGLMIVPEIPAKKLFDIFANDHQYIPSSYVMEIDSQLVVSKLRAYDIAVIIMHDLDGMFGSSNGFTKAVELMDSYLIANNAVLARTDSIHYLELLSFALKDAMIKLTSAFFINLEKDVSSVMDERARRYIADSIAILKGEGKLPYEMEESPIVIMAWVMRLYNRILDYRISARHTIMKGIKFTGSKLLRDELNFLFRRLDRIDDDAVLHESFIDNIADMIKKELHNMKIRGISDYEDDLYQFQFEANNLETQEEAMLLIHQINSRMSVIADFLATEELTKQERTKWTKLMAEYNKLRSTISKLKIYQNKTRLYVNYGADD